MHILKLAQNIKQRYHKTQLKSVTLIFFPCNISVLSFFFVSKKSNACSKVSKCFFLLKNCKKFFLTEILRMWLIKNAGILAGNAMVTDFFVWVHCLNWTLCIDKFSDGVPLSLTFYIVIEFCYCFFFLLHSSKFRVFNAQKLVKNNGKSDMFLFGYHWHIYSG